MEPILLAQTPLELTAANSPPLEFRVLPRGEFKTRKGTFLVDEQALTDILSTWTAHGVDTVVDYEHQTEYAPMNGQKSPAAGWVPRLEAREDGLWATEVQWTVKATEHLSAREYRYFSPVILADTKTRRVSELRSLALVNFPASVEQKPLIASGNDAERPLEEVKMKGLLILLGLAEGASEQDAMTRVQNLFVLTGQNSLEGVMGTLQAWKQSAQQVTVLSGRIAELETAQLNGERNLLIASALTEGKLTPALEPWAKDAPLDSLKAYLSAVTPIVNTKSATMPAENLESTTLSQAEKDTMKLFGVSSDKYLESRKSLQGDA